MKRIPLNTKFALDKLLVLFLVLFCVVSVVSIYCAEPMMNSYLKNSHLWVKQLFWYILGFGMIAALCRFGIKRIYFFSKIIYWILLVMLLILFIDRHLFNLPDTIIRPINGTTAWFQIPLAGSFQPSEFMKIILIILSSEIIQQHNSEKISNSFQSDFRLFIKIFILCAAPLILILTQPDTGIPIVLVVSLIIMLTLSGIRHQWFTIGFLLLATALIGFLYIYFNHPSFLNQLSGGGYRFNRIYGWLEPEKYYRSHGNQLYTSLLALGSSGLSGSGFREFVVHFPEAHTDFIFTVIGQNGGFILASLVIILCFTFDLKLLYIAYHYPLSAQKYMVIGFLGMLLFQQVQNISMIMGLLPITGITLPFISYGGSSMLSTMIPLSIIFIMSSENKIKKYS